LHSDALVRDDSLAASSLLKTSTRLSQRVMQKLSASLCCLWSVDGSQRYLLVDDDLTPHSDGTGLRFVERANPRNEHWSKVKLYLRCQVCVCFIVCSEGDYRKVEALSFRRYGSMDGLAAEIERREEDKRKRKQEKYVDHVRKVCCMLRRGIDPPP
jgi:hypothetical protein